MNNILKNILIFGIPALILIAAIVITIKAVEGKNSSIKPCPQETPYRSSLDGQCLQCDPSQPVGCRECTKNGDECKNGGTCYIEDGWEGKGVCICPTGVSGRTCENVCQDDGECGAGGKCMNGICHCPPGKIGTRCEKDVPIENCNPPNCNSMFVLKLKYRKASGYYLLDLIVDGDYTFTVGQKVKLGGFGTDDTGWGVLNNIDKDNTQAYTVADYKALPQTNNDMCNYWCESDGSFSPDTCGGKVYGPFLPADTKLAAYDSQKCNPPPGSSSKCFAYTGSSHEKFPRSCPKYFMVTLNVPQSAISIPGSENSVYNYINWNSAGYIAYSWNYKGQRYNDVTPTCYNNTTTSSNDINPCMTCLDGWGPGQDQLIKLGYKNLPPMGMCGRRKNLHPIKLALDKVYSYDNTLGYGTTQQCQKSYGDTSQISDQACPFHPACYVCDFWAYPGSNCQLGAWKSCEQCGSNYGKNDEDNFLGNCGGILGNTPGIKCNGDGINSAVGGTGCNWPYNFSPTFPN